jgi:MFS family permease
MTAGMSTTTSTASRLREIPHGVWVLGFVSMFMDISSEMIHALLPIYLVTVLGASALTVGFIEGIAEAIAMITKIFSGALSDWLGKRKALAAFASVGWLTAARFIDRIGKGIRGAPRDALVADLSPPSVRGASYGLRQSLDTVGAFLGPVAAMGLMAVMANNFSAVFWFAVIPAFLAFALILFGVEDAKSKNEKFAPERREVDWFGKQRSTVLQSFAFRLRVAIGGDQNDGDVRSQCFGLGQ